MATITKDMTIQEVVEINPQSIMVFMRHGMGCFGCHVANFENVEEGAMAHGIDPDALVAELNATDGAAADKE